MYFLSILILVNIIYSIEYKINPNYGKIIMNDQIIENPFLGGFNKPKIQWLDWDQDGYDDLFLLDEDGSIKYYHKTSNLNSFELISTNFLGISNISWFFFSDFDSNGDLELMTQDPNNINQIIYYDIILEDLYVIGTIYDINMSPVISDPVMIPTFCDIDNDNDLDFFTGNMIGTVSFYENIGFEENRPKFNFITDYWEEIYVVGPSQNRHGASALTFIDIDNDNDYDLSWGDYYQQSLYIIINIGTSDSPNMDNINVINQYPIDNPINSAGLNMPTFSDIDNDGDEDLFVTVLSGAYGYQLTNNFYYYNVDEQSNFILETTEFISTLDLLSDVSPAIVDINSDNLLDLFIGTDFDPTTFPWTGKIYYYSNNTDTLNVNNEPLWILVDSSYQGNDLGNNISMDFIDIDNDGDKDMFMGDFNGYIKLFENTGTPINPNYILIGNISNIDLSGYSVPGLVDIDLDNDFDLFIGQANGNISFYENIGTPESYNYILISNNYQNISVGSRSVPEFFDIDDDDDFDLIIGSQYNGIVFYENIGSSNNAEYVPNDNISFPYLGFNTVPRFLINKDLIVGVSTGGLYYLSYCSYGNLDQNNQIDINDVLLLINYIVNYLVIDSQCIDLNLDNIINILDIITLINLILE